ncbi:MAG: hypothetical protein E5Y58_29525 [Mesorhizobium sp.]|nr:MAG: hypothetical protein E5Y58_29525 [Mesorhizobium sp.]
MSAAEKMSRRDEMETLLPFYLNGSLEGAELEAVGPTAEGVFRLGIPAATAADYEKVLGLIAAQPFAEAVVEGRKPVDGG